MTRPSVNGSYPTSGGEAEICGEAGHPASPPDAHGTWTAIHRHRRNNENLCTACLAYRRQWNREYSRLRRASAAYRAQHAQLHADWRRRNRERYNAGARERDRRRREELAVAARIDEVAIERAVKGEPVRLNRDEKRAAIQQLLDRGYSLTEAARRLGLNYDYARKYAGVA